MCAKIAEGVVGMVEMVLVRVSEKGILLLEYNKKATKISNLMVVLCAGKAADEFRNVNGRVEYVCCVQQHLMLLFIEYLKLIKKKDENIISGFGNVGG